MTSTDTPPPISYRELVNVHADGVPVDESKLHRWRREEQLLRSAIAFPNHYRDTALSAAHFDAPLHAKTWQAILNAIARADELDKPLPQALVVAELCEIDESLGGNRASNYLALILVDQPVDPKYGLSVLARELLQLFRNRRWRANFEELGMRVDGDKDIASLQADYVRASAQLVYEAQGDAHVSAPLDAMDWDPHERINDQLVKIGVGPIDRYAAGGHGRGEMLVWGAGTGVGKSYAAAAILRAQAALKQRTLYISAEDGAELLYCRTLADLAEPPVSPADIRTRTADAEIVKTAQRRLRDIYAGNIFIAVAKKPTITQVCRLIHTHRYSKDVDLVIVDYLQAISTDEPMTNKVQEMAFVTSALKRTAHQCNVGLVVFSQLAREAYRDGQEPNINACKYCGDIENEAEVMVLMWRDSDGVLHAKLPKIKWAAARKLRFIVPVHDVTGAHGKWVVDTMEDEEDD